MSMFSKLKQFKDLKDRAKEIQAALAQETAEGTAGWGKVKVVINGNQQILSVSIDESVMNDRVKLQELIVEATNDAIGKIQRVMASKLKDIGDLDLAQEFGDAMKS
jgi:DNA-binding YbaB/EbfC family protein